MVLATADSLRDPIVYPNWVWLLGVFALLVAAVWGIGLIVAYRRSRVIPEERLQSLGEVRRRRYERLIAQIEEEFNSGQLSARDAHLSISALVRAAASERLHVNAESLSVEQASAQYARWPAFAAALEWCEQPSFGLDDEAARRAVHTGLDHARAVVSQ